MLIRPYTESDAARLAALHATDGPPFTFRLHGPERATPRWKRTVVAEDGQQLVGVATAGQNTAHPGWYSVGIDVAAGHRRRGIGSALLAELRGMLPAPKPMIGKIWADDAAAAGFAAAVGAAVIQRSPPMTVQPHDPEVRRWASEQRLPAGIAVRTGDEPSREALTRLWTDLYKVVHQSWAPADTDAALHDLFADVVDTVDRTATRIAYRGEVAAAVAFVVATPEATLLCCETLTPDEPDGERLVGGLLALTFGAMAAELVHLDGHVTDPHLWPVAAGIPHLTGRELLVVEAQP